MGVAAGGVSAGGRLVPPWLRCGIIWAVRSAAIALVVATVGLVAPACDKGTIAPSEAGGYRIAPATYGVNSNVSPEAQKKCRFDSELTAAVAEAASEAKPGDGRGLTLVITRIRGAEPAWEGEIIAIVEGELEAHGDVIGNFRVQRRGLGGVSGGMRGVCRGLDTIAADIAADIGAWLDDPGTDSKLGG